MNEIMKYNMRDLDSVRERLSIMEGRPWLAKPCVDAIEKVINKEWIIVEFGAGGSTIWFSERAKKVYSFEANILWYEALEEELLKKKLENVVLYYSKGPTHLEKFYKLFKDEEIDLILIDSPWRLLEYLEELTPQVRSGGYVLFDNAARGMGRRADSTNSYTISLEFLDNLGWERTDFFGVSGHDRSLGGGVLTATWKKP